MPRLTRITPELLAEVKRRRGSGEQWKLIQRDLRERGVPCSRMAWWRAQAGQVVTLHPQPCPVTEDAATPPE